MFVRPIVMDASASLAPIEMDPDQFWTQVRRAPWEGAAKGAPGAAPARARR